MTGDVVQEPVPDDRGRLPYGTAAMTAAGFVPPSPAPEEAEGGS
jgi:hypothetical protein